MKSRILLLILTIAFLISCDRKGNTKAQSSDQAGLPSPTNIQSTDSNKTSQVKLNPAHGLPGHRCDLEVGAILPETPMQGNSIQTTIPGTSTQPIAITPAQKAPVQTIVPSKGAGLNPAHGQPGHRCDIAVGAPLNSKPTQ